MFHWLASLAFLSVFVSPFSAQATPVGMCSHEAESIAAPPPLYPSSSAQLENCERLDLTRGPAFVAPLDQHQPHSAPCSSGPHDVALLPLGELVIPRQTEEPSFPSAVTSLTVEEHRFSLRRPPRA